MSTIQKVVRVELSPVSDPPNEPIDSNTGFPPRAWRSSNLAVELGIFDSDLVAVDLSDLAYLQVVIYEDQLSVTPLVTKTVYASDIIPVISRSSWVSGGAQQATATFSAAEMDQSLDAKTSKELWMVVQGGTDQGEAVVYGAGPFTLYLASGGVIPAPATVGVSRHEQTNSSGDVLVTPTSYNHKEIISYSGSAGTRIVVLGTEDTVAGAEVTVLMDGPASPVADIVFEFRSGEDTGALLYTLTTDAFQPNTVLRFDSDGTNFECLSVSTPAFA